MFDFHYDVIIIGTGAGGGTLANRLASSGEKILVLERGSFLPREKTNWDAKEVLYNERYRPSEVWYDKKGTAMRPGTSYFVGGNTKFYGGALFRFREKDFETVVHKGGISPEWPLKYRDFAPYYTQAEKLYEVHGKRGLDPTEPQAFEDYPFPAISHEPVVQELHDALKAKEFHPFYMPLAIKLNEANRLLSPCIRCETCDGFPCFLHAKADADVNGVRPAMAYPNLTLITEAKVLRLHTSASGREITRVETEIAGEHQMFSADIIVVACGAINSALLLLKSASDRHPNGLANHSGLVGRNYMTHNNGVIMALTTKPNPTVYQKTLAIHDFYWGDKDFAYPMGAVQLLGNVNQERIAAHGPPFIPSVVTHTVAKHSVAWWVMTEDLPNPNNRVYLKREKIVLDYTDNNLQSFNHLMKCWIKSLKSIDTPHSIGNLFAFFKQKIALKEVGHQCGTCRFGEDPNVSVLDLNCRTHEIDNLYVVDGSFFPSSAALNPSLTIIANALRVGEHLLERMNVIEVRGSNNGCQIFPAFPNKISFLNREPNKNLSANVQKILSHRDWINSRTNRTVDQTRVLGVVAAGKGAENYLPYTIPKAIQQIAEIGLGADIIIGLNNGFECPSVTDGFDLLPNVQVIHLYTGEKATNATPAPIFENSITSEPYCLNNNDLKPNQHRIFVVHQKQGLHSPGKIRVLGDIYGSLILGSIDRGWIPPAFTVTFDAESLFLVSQIGMPPNIESNGLKLIINELQNNRHIDVLGANNRYAVYQKKQVNTTEVLLPDFDVDLPPIPWFLNVLHGQYRGFVYKPASCTVGKTDAIASLFAAMAEQCPGTRMDDAHLTILAQYAGFPGDIFMDVVSTNRVPKVTDLTADDPPKLAWIEQVYRWMTSLQGMEKHYGKFPVDSICTTSFPWNVAIDPLRFIKRAIQLEKLTFPKLMRNIKSLFIVFWVFLKLKKKTIENADILQGAEAKASW